MFTIHNILHPTDFSPRADYAFRLACALAQDHGARLLVLHVEPPPPPTVIALHGAGISPEYVHAQHESLMNALRQIQVPGGAVPLEHRLEGGDPATAILSVAQEAGSDLIVMGTQGRTGLGRLLLGSVAEQVVRRAPCPVLTVRAPLPDAATRPGEALRVILHPTDFSPYSQNAFRIACALARRDGARIIVVHIAPLPAVGAGLSVVPPPVDSDTAELEARLREAHAADGIPVEFRLGQGNAATLLVDLARTTPCDLIVMGTHGRTGLARLVMGSVAEEVLRNATCPVLTVKTPLPPEG